ncbi:MAG: nucleotidyltransferase domain-containing protein [Proteiniphilum sp.]
MQVSKTIGTILRELRSEKGLLLREVGAELSIDPTILSKIERNERMPTREQVKVLADFYREQKNEVIIAWLSDKLVNEVQDEDLALQAIQVAEEKVAYKISRRSDKSEIINQIVDFLKKDGRVEKAWIFGSFARGDDNANSDVDLMIRYSDKASGTLLDYADIQYRLQNLLQKKIDLSEEGYIKPFAWKTIQKDLKLIYG